MAPGSNLSDTVKALGQAPPASSCEGCRRPHMEASCSRVTLHEACSEGISFCAFCLATKLNKHSTLLCKTLHAADKNTDTHKHTHTHTNTQTHKHTSTQHATRNTRTHIHTTHTTQRPAPSNPVTNDAVVRVCLVLQLSGAFLDIFACTRSHATATQLRGVSLCVCVSPSNEDKQKQKRTQWAMVAFIWVSSKQTHTNTNKHTHTDAQRDTQRHT